jgi:glycine/D-amino acid oxidase-like deaminating enzyme/nitrite reductase/ring-hydroxylating ferredoxin subunit
MSMNRTLWSEALRPQLRFQPLARDPGCDVAIVGGGIAGLHAAWSLRRSGLRVIVLEARRIGLQATGRSTAKVTSQHGLRYAQLIRDHGREHAALYAEHNQRAVAAIAKIARQLPDAASFEERDAYVIARNDQEAAKVRAETDAARSLSLPATLELPKAFAMNAQSAMRFTGQGQFDPVAYQLGLAELVAHSTTIFEDSRVTRIEESERQVALSVNGHEVHAAKVIVATQMPIISEGKFFARAFPFAHAVAAAPLPGNTQIDGMFITAGSPSFSWRTANSGGKRCILAASPEYKPGEPKGQKQAVAELAAFLRDNFGVEPTHMWTNEDFRPMDQMPFVGPATGSSKRLFVATGFDAWGITNSFVAGEILAAAVTGQKHPAAPIFDPQRSSLLKGASEFVKGNVQAGLHLAGDRLLRAKASSLDELEPGQGSVVSIGAEQLAVVRAEDGSLSAVSAVCTHMGCIVDWNHVDRSWDCPCHGSRFDRDGRVIAGPATEALARRELPARTNAK